MINISGEFVDEQVEYLAIMAYINKYSGEKIKPVYKVFKKKFILNLCRCN